MPVKPQPNGGPSVSAEDLDEHLRGQDAAGAEAQRIEAWTKPTFAQNGRHQAQLDPTYGYKERK